MSYTRKLTSLVSGLALFATAGSLAAGCGNKDGTPGTDGSSDCADIGVRVDALNTSTAALTTLAASVKTDVFGACARLAGQTVAASPTDQQVTDTCDAAKLAIQAKLNANVAIVVVPPACSVKADAQLNCEADCYAKAQVTCDPGAVDLRCDPGELSVKCGGTCKVGATCEGSADLAVACEGSCSGECDGDCKGTCTAKDGNGKCIGSCDGTCTGQCKGGCKVTAEAGVKCTGEARCKGGCDGTFEAPTCEANLKPPACEGSAEANCSADCEASASLQATCTKPTIDVKGDMDADFKAKLTTELPTLLEVAGKAKLGLEAVNQLGTDVAAVSTDALKCTFKLGSSVVSKFSATATAAASATASASVSFQASASVTASASGGAG
jgi:hypothetical protein